jgi:hypothetical protein
MVQVEVDEATAEAMNVDNIRTNNKAAIVIGVTVTIVILLAVCFLGNMLSNYMNRARLEEQAMQQIQKEVQLETKQTRQHTSGGNKNVDEVDAVIDEFRHDTEQKLSGVEIPGQDGEVLEEQYNPLHDFAVFGVGNDRLGGNQTLQQKMNLADELSSPSESEDHESKEDYTTKD